MAAQSVNAERAATDTFRGRVSPIARCVEWRARTRRARCARLAVLSVIAITRSVLIQPSHMTIRRSVARSQRGDRIDARTGSGGNERRRRGE